ncbi:MAG: WxcM-like domain-containing protein, partial [Gilliamella sp.]|nr:WxcM-like domain-containing protein [Gilliamella sp.]
MLTFFTYSIREIFVDNYKLINLERISDARGSLVVIENSKQIPFEIKRIFYVYD